MTVIIKFCRAWQHQKGNHLLKILSVALTTVLVSCNAPNSSLPKLDCPTIGGIDTLLSNKTKNLIVFGEVHGTEESPAFIGDVICRSLEMGYPTIAAFEFSKSVESDVISYLNNVDELNAKEALLKTSYWYGGGQEGKKSKAMFDLLQRLKKYRLDGYAVDFHFFDVTHEFVAEFQGLPRAQLEQARESQMAKYLEEALTNYPEQKIVTLTGNFHSALWHREENKNAKFSMTSNLPRDKLITLNMNAQPGTAWTWIGGVTKVGGTVHPAFMDGETPSSNRAIHLFEKVTNGHDGLYYTVSKTVSEPTNR